MIRPLANLLYRHKDPTRNWREDPTQLTTDVERRTVCGLRVGGVFEGLASLGPASHAQHASRGYPEWHSKGLKCIIEDGRIGDITIFLRPTRPFAPFPGRFLRNGTAITLAAATTPEQLIQLLGEPFGRSNNDWDSATMLFYENESGEAQFAFDKNRNTLDSIEFWYEPELSQKDACKTYGIDKSFPDIYRRKLSEHPEPTTTRPPIASHNSQQQAQQTNNSPPTKPKNPSSSVGYFPPPVSS